MSLLLVTSDAKLSAHVRDHLAPGGWPLHVQEATSDAAGALQTELPEALLVDLGHQQRERLRLVAEVRRSYPAADIPILAFFRDDTVRRAALEHLPAASLLERIPADLLKRVQDAIRLLQPAPGQAHPYALETLARIWRQGLSGFVQVEGRDVPVCDGGLTDPEHLPLLERALGRGGVRFQPDHVVGLGDWFTLGQALWHAARTRARGGFWKRHQDMLLKDRPNAARAEMLPLAEATQHLLADRRSSLPLRRRLAALHLEPAQVEPDLEVLYLLGLYRFVPAPRRTPDPRALSNLPPPTGGHRPAPVDPSISDVSVRGRPEVRGPIDEALKQRLELRRLRREAETLERADEWTILGLRPTADGALIHEAGERMRQRYAQIAGGHADPEARALAQRIGARVDEALAVLGELAEIYRLYGEPDRLESREEVAFREGLVALRQKDFERASRFFTLAYDEQMQSPRNLAYRGWAAFRARGDGPASKQQVDDALESLQLAESLGPGVSQTQFFLAAVESHKGDLDRAEERLARLIKQGGAPEEVHSLFRKVRQQRPRA